MHSGALVYSMLSGKRLLDLCTILRKCSWRLEFDVARSLIHIGHTKRMMIRWRVRIWLCLLCLVCVEGVRRSLPSSTAPIDSNALLGILTSDFVKSGSKAEAIRSLILNNVEKFKGENATENVVVVEVPTSEEDATFIQGLADISRGDIYTVSATSAKEMMARLENEAVSESANVSVIVYDSSLVWTSTG
eukprot:Blabericola_migrator_1__1825@NODE_1496_length_4425_cov_25_758375_g982_i0_p2_GENE_NODE_1496_length_4425_cov_25_758375_g982_i0NODE_1496_length_4425_cov_25_758375_g982_i0_p2_ORF_typecomplete_len190_score19_39NAD_binding_5/PF07994_12/0_038_NODE_1496_length_4425_cov_25_758375_g982_i032553824